MPSRQHGPTLSPWYVAESTRQTIQAVLEEKGGLFQNQTGVPNILATECILFINQLIEFAE
jgi:hypothetical protein